MNYLAHAYLSFRQPGLLLGNMMSDFIKGKEQYRFPEEIQRGIRLHRAIDDFTDHHIATKDAKEIFKPYYRLYSAAFIDIVFDHFLATDSHEFPNTSLYNFSLETYALLDTQKAYFTAPFAMMYNRMKYDNWLYNYHTFHGVQFSFNNLVRRAKFLTDSAPAYEAFQKEYHSLKICYDHFFGDLKTFTNDWIKSNGILITPP